MANPDDFNNNNNPVKSKQKEGKEFAQENKGSRKGSLNLESDYRSKGVKPVSINMDGVNESRGVGHSTPKNTSDLSGDWATVKKQEALTSRNNSGGGIGNSSGGLSEDPKLSNSSQSNRNDVSRGSSASELGDSVICFTTS